METDLKLETPIKSDATANAEDLALCFSELRVDRQTVEGSPIMKRADIKSTPAAFRFASYDQEKSTTEELDSALSEEGTEIFYTPCARAVGGGQQRSQSKGNKVMVFVSSSDEHDTGNHQENALRTELLSGPNGCLRREQLQKNIEFVDEAMYRNKPAPISDLMRVHETSYLQHLQNRCRIATSSNLSSPTFCPPQGYLDSDTPLTPSSLDAASKFCNAAMVAVDRVMEDEGVDANGESKRAFVIGRPPGHHAGPAGCVPSEFFWRRPEMTSSGFCLLNTAAVTAAYARYKYGRDREKFRVAIVDIDVHHGNGTEEIVRNLVPHQRFLPLPSSYAPVSTMGYKPWLDDSDREHVFFASINLYAEDRFYPCSGKDSASSAADGADALNIINVTMTPIGPGPWDQKARAKLTAANKDALCAQASSELREKVLSNLLPRMKAFGPDLLLISAGFDAHYDDMYHFLSEDDYHWLTEKLCEASSDGDYKKSTPVVSILEGGYSLSSTMSKALGGKGRKRGGERFAQQSGDGGLVKGVLAHAAALANLQEWIQVD